MKSKIFAIVLPFCFLLSCRRNVLDIPPQDRIAENVVWTDQNLVAAYENNLYNAIPHGFYIHMYSWTMGYQYLRETNLFLQKMADPKSIQFNTKQQLVGEVHFLRAFIYFN